MTDVHILNVGQGSCAVVLSPDGSVTVIDGGTTAAAIALTDPVAWLRDRGVTRIDSLVLTHLHRDHAQGLLHLARAFPVGQAHVPYAAITLPPRPAAAHGPQDSDVDSPAGQYQLVEEYRELLEILAAAGTPLVTMTSGRTQVWGTPAAGLSRIFPLPEDRVRTPALVAALSRHSGTTGRRGSAQAEATLIAALDELSETTNAESAVYVLRAPGTAIIVFAGDHAGPGSQWERIGAREDLRRAIWILPHHGRPDGPPPEFYRARTPLALIASASAIAQCAGYWADLAEDTGCLVESTASSLPGIAVTSGTTRLWIDAAGKAQL